MMSTARLRELYKQEQNHRKFACVRNDMVKTQLDQYEGFIDKEKQESVQRNRKSIVYTRKNVVRRHVLDSCMKNKRDETERNHVTTLYGQYNGATVEDIAGEIDDVIERNHPRNRRRKKIEELFSRGYRKGAILDTRTVQTKVDRYFEKPLVEVHVGAKAEVTKAEKQLLPPLTDTNIAANVDLNTLERRNRDTDIDNEDRLFVRKKVNKYLEEDIPDDISMHSDVASHRKLTSTRVVRPITLPPIKIGTDNSTADGKPVTDSITDIIARINHAKDRREREVKVKKERREKRIRAERIRGIGQSESNEPEVESLNKTTPSFKSAGLLNLTAPVFSKSISSRTRRHGTEQGNNNDVIDDVNKTGDANIGESEERFILPPLKLQRNSIGSKK